MSKYDLTSSKMPEMPCVKGYLNHLISNVPSHMRAAAALQSFSPAYQHLSRNVTFRYIDNTEKRGCDFNGMGITVSPSGNGKGYLEAVFKAVSQHWRRMSEENLNKLMEWARTCKSKGQTKDRPQRPRGVDAVIYTPVADQTPAAFIQNLVDAEEAGECSLYTSMPELDMITACAGGKAKVTKIIRLNHDAERDGTLRVTEQGVIGNPTLRWKWNASCVAEKARRFFCGDTLIDGTLGRITFAYVPKNSCRKMPRQGNYDETYQEKLEEYLLRLRNACGCITIHRLNKLILRLKDELDEISDLSDDEVFEGFAHRSLQTAWMRGCVLYIVDGCRWTKEAAEWVEWSLYYDLASKINVFAPQMRKAQGTGTVDVRKFGPTNMLDLLPTPSFSQAQLEKLRLDKEMPANCSLQLNAWKNRGYITYSPQTGLYTKTEEYLRKHPQTAN